MNNRIYYGEYSLEHWINLVLKNNIILPPYQRLFVWQEKDVKTLIETFKKKQFVPPVTIGAYKREENNKTENLILDGQQRLTSILLAYLGLFPDEKQFKAVKEQFANENDEPDEEDEPNWDNILEWNLKELTKKGTSKEKVLSEIVEGNYKPVNFGLEDTFFQNTFLGFSYLVPEYSDQKKQQMYYSSVFRHINIQGQALLPQESRQALYFLDKDLVDFFAPQFCKRIIVKLTSSESKADFVRYLSLLAQYKKEEGRLSKVARGYKPKMEQLYEKYINATITNQNSDMFGQFTTIIPNRDYHDILRTVETVLDQLNVFRDHPSIIDVDVFLFGLVYQIVFLKMQIDLTYTDDLKRKLEEQIQSFKTEAAHSRAPNNLGNLRKRIEHSIIIYANYVH